MSSTVSWSRPVDNRGDVQLQVGQDGRHLHGMDKVGLSGQPDLSLVDLGGVDIGLFNQAEVRPGKVTVHLFKNVVEADHLRTV